MKYMDKAQTDLDAAARRYRKQYDRGFLLSQKGEDVRAQQILDRANAEYDAAKAAFAEARARNPIPARLVEQSRRIEATHRGGTPSL